MQQSAQDLEDVNISMPNNLNDLNITDRVANADDRADDVTLDNNRDDDDYDEVIPSHPIGGLRRPNARGNGRPLLQPRPLDNDRDDDGEVIAGRPMGGLRQPNARGPSRPLPQPRPFDGKSNNDINLFFTRYERYATSCWGNDSELWLDALENLLQGWALVLYRGLLRQGKTYNQIKRSLKAAFPTQRDPFKTRNLLKLVNIKLEAGEPLPVFFHRIESLIGETYPELPHFNRKIQTRDTFLMKLSPDVAEKIANFCTQKNNFSPETVAEAATVVGSPELWNTNRGGEEVFLMENKKSDSQNMKCYLCAGSWHPISACPLYHIVFSCPLCRQEAHPITDCHFYKSWKRSTLQWQRTGDLMRESDMFGREEPYSNYHRELDRGRPRSSDYYNFQQVEQRDRYSRNRSRDEYLRDRYPRYNSRQRNYNNYGYQYPRRSRYEYDEQPRVDQEQRRPVESGQQNQGN